MLPLMDTYGERLAEALAHAAISRVAFSKSIGISPQATAMVLNGQTKALTAENTAHAARVLGVNYFWLATGTGPMAEGLSAIAMDAARLIDSVEPARRVQLLAMLVQVIDFAEAQSSQPAPATTATPAGVR